MVHKSYLGSCDWRNSGPIGSEVLTFGYSQTVYIYINIFQNETIPDGNSRLYLRAGMWTQEIKE